MDWAAAALNKVCGNIDGIPVEIIGRNAYISNKRATGRAKDIADIEALGAQDS